MLELVVYQDAQGWQPFEAWFEHLDLHAARKVTAAMQRMAQGNLADVKSVGAGVLERRIDWGPGYRIYFGRDGDHPRRPAGRRHKEAAAAGHRGGTEQMGRLQAAQEAAGQERRSIMSKALTRPFAAIVEDRVRREPAFGSALLEEAAQCMLSGELAVARNLVRDVIKGSMGYAELSRRTGTPEKSLVRMFGPNGNPTAANLSRIFAHLQRYEGVNLQVSSVPAPSKKSRKRSSSSPHRAT